MLKKNMKGNGKNPAHFGKNAYSNDGRDVPSGGGVYAYLPFDNVDSNNNAIFKIGMTTDFRRREGNYHTYLPEGVWRVAMLINPTKHQNGRTEPKYYRAIEKNIFAKIRDKGGKVISENYRPYKEGETEWVYANESIIEEAFGEAYNYYGGDLQIGTLDGLPRESDASFVGKIFYY